MKRLIVLLAAALMIGGAGVAFAQDDKPTEQGTTSDKPMKADEMMKSGKEMSASGTVKSLTGSSFVVTDKKGKDWTFSVNPSTKFIEEGGSHLTAQKKAEGEPVTLMDAVKEGAKVTVKYHKMEGKMLATTVRVMVM